MTKITLNEMINLNNIQNVEYLLKTENYSNSNLSSALILSIENNQKRITKLLLEYGADPRITNCDNYNAFDIATIVDFDLKCLNNLRKYLDPIN